MGQIDNMPLTIEELKHMVGKPVWVIWENSCPCWEIISGFDQFSLDFTDGGYALLDGSILFYKNE